MKYYLAFSYNVHDSSVSIADEERVLLVLEAERYYGVKKKGCDHAEMEELIAEALRYCGISIAHIDGVACTAYKNAHLPVDDRDCDWSTERRVEILGRSFETQVINHHLAHAAMVYAFPGGEEVAIDVCDGGGDFGDTHRIYLYQNGKLTQLPNRPIHDLFSSRFYDVASRHIYKRMMCEGKLMALASIGEPQPDMMDFIRDHLTDFNDWPTTDSLTLLERHYPVYECTQEKTAFDLAASMQRVFEELRVESVEALPADTSAVLLAGGSTLNILANTCVKQHLGPHRQLLIPPCCDDTGQSLGALLYYCHDTVGLPITAAIPFLGYSDRLDTRRLAAEDASDALVECLVSGGIVFLHRGQSEIGPRALGHRSIITLPSQKNHDLINHVIKGREFYRPLAPIIPLERVSDWFDWEGESKYMLHAAVTRERTWSAAPGICHYDNTARIQTIAQADDPFLHALLERIGDAVSCPMLINTSLNPRGIPITSRLEDTCKFQGQVSGLNVRIFHEGRLLGN
ncbi:Decarbamoylnovobiocin carbamoyltransferase [Candidatus Entotheonellaceae bacterium PAL068K]